MPFPNINDLCPNILEKLDMSISILDGIDFDCLSLDERHLLSKELVPDVSVGVVFNEEVIKQICDGKKRAVVRARKHDSYDRINVLCSDEFAYGLIKFMPMESIDRKDLIEKESDHSISKEYINKKWRTQEKFAYYKIAWFLPLETPVSFSKSIDTNSISFSDIKIEKDLHDDELGSSHIDPWLQGWFDAAPKSGGGNFSVFLMASNLSESQKDMSMDQVFKEDNIFFRSAVILQTSQDDAIKIKGFFGGQTFVEEADGNPLAMLREPITFPVSIIPNISSDLLEISEEPFLDPFSFMVKRFDKIFKVDSGKWAMGVWKNDFYEFVFKGKKLQERYVIKDISTTDQPAWWISRPTDQTLFAATHDVEEVKATTDKLIWAQPSSKAGPRKPIFISSTTEISKSWDCEILKDNDSEEKRIVFGIALEPEVVDLQGDIISKEEIENVAHEFMLNHQTFKIQHKVKSPSVRIVESFIAPSNFSIGKEKVKKGSWVVAVKILDEEIWGFVKDGTLTGFSIGGFVQQRNEVKE